MLGKDGEEVVDDIGTVGVSWGTTVVPVVDKIWVVVVVGLLGPATDSLDVVS